MLIDSLFKLSKLEAGPRMEGKVYPVFSFYEDLALEHALGGASEMDDANLL